MANGNSWEEFVTEFGEINRSEGYKPFQPLLDALVPVVGLADPTPEEQAVAIAALNVVENLHSEYGEGNDDKVQIEIEKIKGGFVQPSWLVKGDVTQVDGTYENNSRQFVQNIFVQTKFSLPDSENIEVPIILVVMTKDEANELISGDAFPESYEGLKADFEKLKMHLDNIAKDWEKRYDDKPKKWKPLGGKTIETIVNERLNGLENEMDEFDRPLEAKFMDIKSLTAIDNRYELRHYRGKGCIVILDIISMRHPDLQRAFHQTLLDASPKTSILNVAPSPKTFERADSLSVFIQLKLDEMEVVRRFNDPGSNANERLFDEYFLADTMSWLTSRLTEIDLPIKQKKNRATTMVIVGE